ncbi:hypothetical protein ACIRRH_30780 [Kitasatospora sp. NPDC101235]|uniref:hypothetical protein n=1 Tax=Kitasatospora sp. NPDC101235 TaxID=3364101 RepID=UPI00381889F6
MEPVFKMFPDTGQLRLANRATTGLVAFDVDPPAPTWFLQVVAIGPDCAPLGGRAPDIELRAGTGLITTVPQSPATASIADESGKQVASASWTRDPTDVFTVELDIADPDLRTWNVRITNNDPEELGFVWTSAGSVTDGQQPRLAMNTTVHVTVRGTAPDVTVPVANIGPGTLTFRGAAGTEMGAGFSLKSFPASLTTNACGRLVLGVAAGGPFAEPLQSRNFTLDCNDTVAANRTLQLSRDQQKDGKDGKEHKDGKEGKEHKDKEHKDHVGKELEAHAAVLGGPPGDRTSAHFIRPELRPDLSDSALRNENPEQP